MFPPDAVRSSRISTRKFFYSSSIARYIAKEEESDSRYSDVISRLSSASVDFGVSSSVVVGRSVGLYFVLHSIVIRTGTLVAVIESEGS